MKFRRSTAPRNTSLAARSAPITLPTLGAPPRITQRYGAEQYGGAPGQVSIDAGREVGEVTVTPGERLREAGRTVWRSVVTPALILWAVCRWVSCPVRREGRRAALIGGYGPDAVGRLTKRLTVMIALRSSLVAMVLAGLAVVAWRNDLVRWPVLVLVAVAWVLSPALAGLGRPPAAAPVVRPGPDYRVIGDALDRMAETLSRAAVPAAPALDPVQQAFVEARVTPASRPVAVLHREEHADGWGAVVDLGGGLYVSQVVDHHEALASALDVWPVTRLHLDGEGRRLVMRVADRDPFEDRRTSPLLEASQWDPWTPVPIGMDSAGRPVSLRMLEQAVLIAGRARHGKTTLARILVVAGHLHAGTGLSIWSAKGNGDWAALEPVADRWAIGGDTAGDLAEGLAGITAEMEDTYRLMKARKVGEITPAMVDAGDVRCRLLVVDELQHYLQDPAHGREVLGRLGNIARLGPAAGVMVIAAPHRPDATAVPSQLRSQFGVRVALRVAVPDDGKVILGRNYPGADPSTITRKGEAIILGTFERPGEPVRALIDAFDLDDLDGLVADGPQEVPQRPRVVTSGPPDQDTRSTSPTTGERPFDGVGEGLDVISRALGAFLPSEERLWTQDIGRRIGWPGTPGTLGTAIIQAATDAGCALKSHQIKLLGQNNWGFKRGELEVVAEVASRVAVASPTPR